MIDSQLDKLIKQRKLRDVDILKACGFTRPTLAKIKNGGNINVDTIVSLAKGLGVKVGYFFDEDEVVEVHTAGRDFVEQGSIEHSGTEFNAPMTTAQCDLVKENAELKRKLIEAQERIIKLMEEKK